METSLSRRDLVMGAAVSGAAAYGAFAAVGRSQSRSDPVVVGVVRKVRSSSIVIRRADEHIDVRVGSDTRVVRDGPAALRDLRVGDEVVVEGEWSDDTFAASLITPMLRTVKGRVMDVSPSRLTTTGGPIRLTAITVLEQRSARRVRAGLQTLREGTMVTAEGRVDPAKGFTAMRIVAEA